MKSILMIGQSNMAGRGFIKDVKAITNENILMLRNGRWQMMSEPINFDREVAGVSLAASFAAMYSLDNPKQKIGLIPCAEGGSSIDEWSKDSVLLQHAISETKFALKNSELIAIIWHQGENDSFDQKYLTYKAKLISMINYLRKELDCENIPFIMGELGDYLNKNGYGLSAKEYPKINEIIYEVANELNDCYFVSAKNLSANADGIHFDAYSQRIFGIRYYHVFKTKQHLLQPLENEKSFLEQIDARKLTVNEKMYLLNKRFALGLIDYETFIKEYQKLT